MNFLFDTTQKAGTLGGMLTVLFLQISNGEVVKTIVLAALGAGVSFCVTLALKVVVRGVRKRILNKEQGISNKEVS